MSDIDDLIETMDRVCASLDRMAENDKKFCGNLCEQFGKMSWETLRVSNDLKQIKEYVG